MDWNPDYEGLGRHLQSLELKTLDRGTPLYRGTFEGTPNEDWTTFDIRGVKYFSQNMEYARRFAKRKDHPTRATPDKGAKGLLFCAKIVNSCKVLIFSEIAETYSRYVRPPIGMGRFDLFAFERNNLMPIIRKALGDDVWGYVDTNNVEILLDLNYAELHIFNIEIVEPPSQLCSDP